VLEPNHEFHILRLLRPNRGGPSDSVIEVGVSKIWGTVVAKVTNVKLDGEVAKPSQWNVELVLGGPCTAPATPGIGCRLVIGVTACQARSVNGVA